MLPIYIYMLTYILPTFLLITLATYVILHNNRAVENRLIFVLLMMFCVTLVGEFLRHVSPFSYNPRIAVYVVGFSTSIAMAIVFHLQFILLKQHCPITIHPLVPFLGYLFISLHAIITLFFVIFINQESGPIAKICSIIYGYMALSVLHPSLHFSPAVSKRVILKKGVAR